MIKYIHLRYKDAHGEMNPKGGVTIAYCFDNGVLQWGFSQCNPADNYVKKFGRIKAEGKMKSHCCDDFYYVCIPKDYEIRDILVKEYLNYKKTFVYNIEDVLYKVQNLKV